MADSGLVVPGALSELLVRELQELELSPYEARVLLALIRLGSGNSSQVASLSGVPRTSTYQVMEELNRKGLAQRLSVDGPATWSTPGREEVLDRLEALLEERLRQQRERTVRVRDLLASSFPDTPITSTAYVHVLQAAHVETSYARLLATTRTELLVFNRPPYSKMPDEVNPAVMEALDRGVKARALYQSAQWHDAGSESFRAAMAQYHRAGVKGALVDELPVKLAVCDRRAALVAMIDPVLPEVGFPTTLLVEHSGFAAVQAEAFEHLWEQAEPVEAPADGPVPLAPTSRRRRAARYSTAVDSDGSA